MLKKIGVLVLVVFAISCNQKLSESEKVEYIKKGNTITKAAFKQLSSQLIEQMQQGGPQQAIPFCNVEAAPIVSKLSEKYNVAIKRTSLKLRNPNNKPTSREAEVLSTFENLASNNEIIQPIVEKDAENNIHYYAPIKMQGKCLVCHGVKNETLNVKTDSLLKTFYPEDLAIGYKEGDLRGIWSLTFN
ncbi:MAG TPA: DUF3365 domain-containing protein [Flavobacteriaceae bacterium]|nr:DUF3365 domain-containing protein [Flavobacteriaceae bacterium]